LYRLLLIRGSPAIFCLTPIRHFRGIRHSSAEQTALRERLTWSPGLSRLES
jgi:hypothetical protein